MTIEEIANILDGIKPMKMTVYMPTGVELHGIPGLSMGIHPAVYQEYVKLDKLEIRKCKRL